MTSLRFDAHAAQRVEALYLTPDVIEQRREVLRLLDLSPGESVLDIGTGPGLLAVEMAAVVGPTGRVSGADPSDDMLALARGREVPVGSAPIQYDRGSAERLPYPDASFDVAVSTQVLEYVVDLPAALAQLYRVLRPGGRVLVVDTDWDSIVWHSGDTARMERVLLAWEQHLADPRLPRTLTGALRRAGLKSSTPRVLPLLNAGFDPATFSAGLMQIISAFVTGRDGLTGDEVQDWAADLASLGPDYFFSLNRYAFLATKPQQALVPPTRA
jgi:ubiquinone/menaquinone biosynthesis C-methylase UbiE